MSKANYVYVTYIAATPEKICDALIDKEVTQQYWGHHNISDWKPGSPWEHRVSDKPEILHIVGKVVETDRPRRLVITWSAPADQGNPAKTSRVTFEIEPAPNAGFHELVAASTKLTVTHDELDSDPEMLKSISNGWPKNPARNRKNAFPKKVSRSNETGHPSECPVLASMTLVHFRHPNPFASHVAPLCPQETAHRPTTGKVRVARKPGAIRESLPGDDSYICCP